MAHRLRRLLIQGVLGMLAAQLLVVGALTAADARRKRRRPRGPASRLRPPPVAVGDSTVQLYTEGQALYAEMLQAIEQARERVCFETFIWKDDAIGRQFKHALERAAERGVAVYVIFDGLANLPASRAFKQFPPAVHALEYPLLSWPWHPLHLRSYARDHRKLLVVDGATAFVGGFNIGAPYGSEWRDTHARIAGPSAGELEHVFVDFWNEHRPRRSSALPHATTRTWERRLIVHRNDPPLLLFPIRSTYLEAIDRAQRHIYLTHAYFIPDRALLGRLLAAAARGVDVRLLVPEVSNHVVADWLARGYYTRCLAGGIRLLRYRDRMVHAKTATIDGVWSIVGTANMDRLSLLGNFEVNLECFDSALARQMERIFADDATRASELTLDAWRRRHPLERVAEAILLPLRPLL